MIHNEHCAVCDGIFMETPQEKRVREIDHAQREDVSFAVLLALVPAMTMTLFELIGLI